MEKISSIVPQSRRVSSTDLAAAPAIRPGVPGFGRSEGSSTRGVKDDMTTAQRAMAVQNKMAEDRKKSQFESDLVSRMSEQFFMQKSRLPAEPKVEVLGPEQEGWKEDELSKIPISKPSVDDYVPPGSFIDVSA